MTETAKAQRWSCGPVLGGDDNDNVFEKIGTGTAKAVEDVFRRMGETIRRHIPPERHSPRCTASPEKVCERWERNMAMRHALQHDQLILELEKEASLRAIDKLMGDTQAKALPERLDTSVTITWSEAKLRNYCAPSWRH